jgi:hypothetical protein
VRRSGGAGRALHGRHPVPAENLRDAQATLLDGFSEVYVADESRRVRLYRDVSGYVMAELSRRFQPTCLGI